MKQRIDTPFILAGLIVLLALYITIRNPGLITALSTAAIAFVAVRGLSDWKDKRRADACAQAYFYFKSIDGSLIQDDFRVVIEEIEAQQDWFFSHRVFLPDTVMNFWLSIRSLARLHQRLNDKRIPENPELKTDIENEIEDILKKAIKEIYRIMGNQELKADTRGFDKKVSEYIRKSVRPK